jgi:site-specific DNA-methyltransferase (adenine-specific)
LPRTQSSIDLRLGDFFVEGLSLDDELFDFVFIDPPYFLSNNGFTVSGGKAVSVNKGSWDHVASGKTSLDFHKAWASEVRRLMKKDATLVVSGTYHSIFECGVALETQGFKILNDLVWFKPNGAPNLSGRRVAASHELMIWAGKSDRAKHVYNYKEMREAEFPEDRIKSAGKQLRSVWWIPSVSKSEKIHGYHPTQKPLRLMRRIISAFTLPGQKVLDPFMGSGTTAVACSELGRDFIGYESDKNYFELAKARIGGAE